MLSYTYATRRSALALAQCRALIARLHALHAALETSELLVVTTGDRIQDRPLAELGGKGLFVKEIEEALLDGRADFAVHSIKPREDPRDALVAPRHGTLAALPAGARVGTSSLRRRASLLAVRPDLRVEPMRGNVDTRLRKADSGEWDAVVLARAGLLRLGLAGRATEILEPEVSLPAVGQGALGVECRAGDEGVLALLATVHDQETATCVAAERGVLLALGGDCKTPLGAYAQRVGPGLRIRAFVVPAGLGATASGPVSVDRRAAWPAAESEAHALGLAVGQELLAMAGLPTALGG
jgi:hydroxymethylbilane synthase